MPIITAKPVATSERHYSVEETAEFAAAINDGQSVSDTVLEGKGKMDTRTRAQYEAFYLRNDLITDGHFPRKAITSKTETQADGSVTWYVYSK